MITSQNGLLTNLSSSNQLIVKPEGRIKLNLEKLTKEKELWSPKISLSPIQGFFQFHFIYKTSTGHVSIGIISQQRLKITGRMKSNGITKEIDSIKRDDVDFETFGICDLFSLCVGVEPFVDYFLSIIEAPKIMKENVKIHRLIPENFEQWILIRGRWKIPYHLLQNTHRTLESNRLSYGSRINTFYWFSLIPHGKVLRLGGEKYWSLSMSTNKMVQDVDGYFTNDITGNSWTKFEDVKPELANELWSITYPNYLIGTDILNGNSSKIVNGNLEFYFDIKIKFHNPKAWIVKREVGENLPILDVQPTNLVKIKKEYDEIVEAPKTIGSVSVIKQEIDDDMPEIIQVENVRQGFEVINLEEDEISVLNDYEMDSSRGQLSTSSPPSILSRFDEQVSHFSNYDYLLDDPEILDELIDISDNEGDRLLNEFMEDEFPK